jgi:hypothetical protein
MEILPGKTLENSGKQNPEMGFKSPPSKRRPLKVHALKYLLRASMKRAIGLCRFLIRSRSAFPSFGLSGRNSSGILKESQILPNSTCVLLGEQSQEFLSCEFPP